VTNSLTVAVAARAIESQCFVIAAAQWGRHNNKRESYGHSLIVDPWGDVLADAGGVDGPGTATDSTQAAAPSIITHGIDIHLVESVRQRMPIQKHRDAALF
jgi:deaminated glutathione amidase